MNTTQTEFMVTFDKKKLQRLLKALKNNDSKVVAGIMGGTYKDGTSVATVGAAHEFGTSSMPRRSWLLDPVMVHYGPKIKQFGKLPDPDTKRVIRDASIRAWVVKLADMLREVIMTGFDSDGYGAWKDVTPQTAKRKRIGQVLTETRTLRNSVTVEVQEA